jgi:hypothetical protein
MLMSSQSDVRPATCNPFASIPMHLSPPIHPVTDTLVPNHDEIAQCAREIWIASGQPDGRDNDIWLDAERRLISAGRAPLADGAISPSSTRKHAQTRPPENAALSPGA